MGADLRLLIADRSCELRTRAGHREIWLLAQTILQVPQDYELFAAIRARALPIRISDHVPRVRVSSWVATTGDGEQGWGDLDLASDCRGDPYTWVAAGDLAPVLARHLRLHPVTAYVGAMRPSDKVILDWH